MARVVFTNFRSCVLRGTLRCVETDKQLILEYMKLVGEAYMHCGGADKARLDGFLATAFLFRMLLDFICPAGSVWLVTKMFRVVSLLTLSLSRAANRLGR